VDDIKLIGVMKHIGNGTHHGSPPPQGRGNQLGLDGNDTFDAIQDGFNQ
jgi:hypothetical protein